MPEIKRCVSMYPPMLDIITHRTKESLQDQGLQVNSIVGYSKHSHKNIDEDMLQRIEDKDPAISFVAGGATYNTQKLLSKWMHCVFFGIIGRDVYGDILENRMKGTAVDIHLDQSKRFSTQWAYVFLSGDERTLIAKQDPNLKYSEEAKKQISSMIDRNTVFYFVSFTFFLDNLSQDSLDILSTKKEVGFLSIVNLSSEEIAKKFKEKIINILPFTDFLIGNKSEFFSLFGEENEEKLLLWLDTLNISYAITDGPNEVIGKIQGGNIQRLTPLNIPKRINTNGAGDSFAAGFISALKDKAFITTKNISPILKAGIDISCDYLLTRE